jgi:hypothetical protein
MSGLGLPNVPLTSQCLSDPDSDSPRFGQFSAVVLSTSNRLVAAVRCQSPVIWLSSIVISHIPGSPPKHSPGQVFACR